MRVRDKYLDNSNTIGNSSEELLFPVNRQCLRFSVPTIEVSKPTIISSSASFSALLFYFCDNIILITWIQYLGISFVYVLFFLSKHFISSVPNPYQILHVQHLKHFLAALS